MTFRTKEQRGRGTTILFFAAAAGLFALPLLYAAYHFLFSEFLLASGFAGVTGFLLFVLGTFVLPLSLLGLCWKLTFHLVRRWRIHDIFALGMVIITGLFLSQVTETALKELLPPLLSGSLRMAKMLASAAAGGIKVGMLFGALSGARANWTEL